MHDRRRRQALSAAFCAAAGLPARAAPCAARCGARPKMPRTIGRPRTAPGPPVWRRANAYPPAVSTLIVFLPSARAQPATEYRYTLTADGHSALRDASAAAALLPEPARPGAEVVAVVPARALSWQRVQLPPGSGPARARAVLEGLLEDRLLDDVGQLHFALAPGAHGTRQPPAPVWVAVCDRAWLREHLQALEAAGRRVARVVPEFAPGPTASGAPQLCALGTPEQAYLVLTGQGPEQGVAVLPLTAMALTLAGIARADDAADPAGADPPALLRAEPAVAELAERTLGCRVVLYSASERALEAARSPWDLAQFELASSGHRRTLRRAGAALSAWLYAPQWRAARWGSALLVGAHLFGLNAWAWQERQLLAAKQAAVRAALTQTFPQVQAVGDAPAQMENAVARLRLAAGSVAARDLEALLAAAGAALPGAQLPGAIEYQPGELRLRGLALAPDERTALFARLQAAGYQASADEGGLLLRAHNRP